jgi:hypothetical protein
MKSARIIIEGENIRKIIDLLNRKENIHYQYDTKDVVILMEEEHYMRIESNLLCVYIFNFSDEKTVKVEMHVGGGKGDWDFDFGAENKENRKMAHSIIEICQQNSWSIIEITPEDFKESLERSATQQFMHSVLSRFMK